MAPSRTRTVKNKHYTKKNSVSSSRQQQPDPVLKSRGSKSKSHIASTNTAKGRPSIVDLLKKKKKQERTYTDEELGIPKLNMITPVGVQKPRGKKKGKVFVDDRESMNTILAMVQAEKEGQIESKMIKARQMEEIREARRVEAEKKEADRKTKLDETKESLRRKRKRPQTRSGASSRGGDDDDDNIKDIAATGTKAAKVGKKKRVAFAED